MDFGALPPEINSGRMYSGPGAGPMLAAAGAWDSLAAELSLAATGYSSVLADLTSGAWIGPASQSMTAAAAPYVSWLSTTAAQAEQTAAQAKAAVAAYEAAFAMTVPPPVIAANRALLMALVATNFFGQNTPAIMATEAHYGEMWAQDAAAMYGYAGASASASTVTPFDSPPQTTNPAGDAGQAAAVAKAAATPAGTTAQTATTTTQLTSAGALSPAAQQASASPVTATSTSSSTSTLPSWLVGPTGLLSTVFGNNANIWNSVTNYPYFALGTVNSLVAVGGGLLPGAPAPSPALGGALPITGWTGLGGLSGGGPVAASVGQASSIGNLSVPSAWAAASSEVSSTAPVRLLATSTQAATGGPGGLLRGIPMTTMGAGRRAAGGFVHSYGFRHAVVTRPPSAG